MNMQHIRTVFMYIPIFILVLLFPFYNSFAEDENLRVTSETPASFFSTGIECFYFSENGLRELKYETSDVGRETGDNKTTTDFEISFTKDGNAVMERIIKDYACPNDKNSNCLSADGIIEKIEVINLIGKKDPADIREHIKTKHKGMIRFGIGSKLYALKTEIPEYDFLSFNDFDKLRCLKDENGDCMIFGTDEETDTPALLGFEKAEKNGEILFIKNIGDNIAYIYDNESSAIFQTVSACLEEETEKLCEKEAVASVKKLTRPDGLNYFQIEYTTPSTKKEIYFSDDSGKGYKAYLNRKLEVTIHMLNKTAAETIGKAL